MANMPQPAQGNWSTGLCDCCADPGGCGWCCYVYWCTCCAYGSIVELMDESVICGGNCLGGCAAYTGMVMLGFPCILQMMSRNHLRLKYGITGDPCQDFCVSWCCAGCALCQEHRELLIRGHTPGGIIRNNAAGQQAATMAPQQQVQMQAPPYPPPPPGGYPGQPPAPHQAALYAAPPPGIYPPMPYPPATGVPAGGYQPGYEQAPPHKV